MARISRPFLIAFSVAATAVCLGMVSAIAAVESGAPPAISLSLLGTFTICGALFAIGLVHHADRRHRAEVAGLVAGSARSRRRQSRRDRRALRRDQRAIRRAGDCSPAVMLEEQLSARYGVPVERVAWHVWRIDGELVEATLDPVTGQLMTGGRELHP